MRKNGLLGAALAIAAALLLPVGQVQAQPAADFYRGKTLRMLIGYGPGGGYDLYGRLVVEFLPRHLPVPVENSNPNILMM
jgi:tripartite-type tricarboxylate transporter receptor subunit TctC